MNYILEKIATRWSYKKKSLSWREKRKEYFICYTILFIIISCVVFSWWFLNDRTFVWGVDGWSQHFRALVYYGKYLRTIIKTLLFEHQLIIPSWDFALGEGNDILQSLHYYVMGDPFSVFSVFIPTRYMHVFYNILILLRLYSSGIAFSLLCFEMEQKNRYAVMAGAISYDFCYWAILNAARHPYFLNPMIYFPLMILGVEKILKNKKPYLFVISVCLSSVSNFYFFYVMVLLCVIYVAVRLLHLYKTNWKEIIATVVKIAIPAVIGVLMGAIVFIPIANSFLNDSRMGVGNTYHFIYPLSYYSRLPGSFVSHSEAYWTCMGYVAPIFLAVCLLFIEKKKNSILKVFLVISGIIICIPFLGQILNGFSYMSNRWIWVLALLTSYILTVMWPQLMNLQLKNAVKLFVCTVIYFVICMLLDYSRSGAVIAAICIIFMFLGCILPISLEGKVLGTKRKQQIALLLIIVSVFNMSYWKNASSASNYAEESIEASYLEENILSNETDIIKDFASSAGIKNTYRYSGRGLTENAGILAGVSSTQYYWSLANPYISEFRTKMEMAEDIVYYYTGYDDRSTLLTLAGVRYFVVPASDNLSAPYGFRYLGTYDIKEETREDIFRELKQELGVDFLTEEQVQIITGAKNKSYKVYKNKYVLPLAYAYDEYTKQQDWERLNSIEKQETMQKSVVLDGYDGDMMEADLDLQSKVIEPEIICNSADITRQGNKYVVTKANASITLKFEGIEKSETYVAINGITFTGTPVYDVYFGDTNVDPLQLYNKTNWNLLSQSTQEAIEKNKLFWIEPTSATFTLRSSQGVSKSIFYRTEDYSFYTGRHDFSVNMKYSDQKTQWITISFSNVGTYTIDSLKVICQPMEGYALDVKKLKNNKVENLVLDTDVVSTEIDLDSKKILCFAIPYSTGWTAYVDGCEVPLYRANDRYMAVEVDLGKHDVILKYQTPLLKIGFIGSILGFGIFIGYVVWKERKQKKGQKNVINSNSSI